MDKKIDKTLELAFANAKAEGATKEQLKEMYEVLKEMYEQAGNVIDDYLENPSEFSGAVDTDKGLVSGSGIEIHAEAISDNEDDEWELKPPNPPSAEVLSENPIIVNSKKKKKKKKKKK